jgi:hypothetical protein
MNLFLALSDQQATILFFAGIVLMIVGGLWTLVVAAQRGVLWFLAVFFLSPLANLIFLFVEPRAIKPFLVSVAGVVAFFWGVFSIDTSKGGPKGDLAARIERIFKGSGESKSDDDSSPGLETPADSLEARQQRIREWKSRLEAKQAALKPGDTAGKAAFDRELEEYKIELEKVKAEGARAPQR